MSGRHAEDSGTSSSRSFICPACLRKRTVELLQRPLSPTVSRAVIRRGERGRARMIAYTVNLTGGKLIDVNCFCGYAKGIDASWRAEIHE
jgi:hypothetical protein